MINSPRDGYTRLLVAANNAISASLYNKLPFDFVHDTVPVAGVMRFTNIMVVPPSLCH
jgi:tripartite-type tricarboxylate transporter receptor subunit TctC